jgi:hypothetical protein
MYKKNYKKVTNICANFNFDCVPSKLADKLQISNVPFIKQYSAQFLKNIVHPILLNMIIFNYCNNFIILLILL